MKLGAISLSPDLVEELKYRMATTAAAWQEEGEEVLPEDLAWELAAQDALDTELAALADPDPPVGEGSLRCRRWIRELRAFLIAVGVYRAMTSEEIRNTHVTSGRPWCFILRGVKYDHARTAGGKE
jgi:hypothetical protein